MTPDPSPEPGLPVIRQTPPLWPVRQPLWRRAQTNVARSIRWRLQIWYALVLISVVGGFAGILYYRARTATFREIDRQLDGGANYLLATLRLFPPHELDLELPDQPPHRPPPPGERHPHPGGPDHPHGPGHRPGGPKPPPLDDAGEPFDFDHGPPGGPGEHAGPGEHGPPFDRRPPPPPDRREHLYENLDLSELQSDPRTAGESRLRFAVWRGDGSLVKSSDSSLDKLRDHALRLAIPDAEPFYIRQPDDHLALVSGPHGTAVLVGRSVRRELNDLSTFGWQLLSGGALALAVGLVGGWIVSARVLRPIASISSTAATISESNLSRRIDTARIDSELAGLAEVLNAMFGRLEAAFERQTRFAADASHELRTPLAILHANLELALTRPRSAEGYCDTLRTCLAASGRMRTLVDSLLVLARADVGSLDLELKPVDLGLLLDEVVAQYAPLAEAAGIHLEWHTPDEPVMVLGDATFLARIPANLLANALRHTPAGGQVQVLVAADGSEATLTVADTGCGIPAADQPRVFERFFRADKARSRESGGCGLGLAICKSLVEAHRGRIEFRSREGQGTRFVMRLPRPTAPRLLAVR